jgi:putative ABC transport system substrate-binding protein
MEVIPINEHGPAEIERAITVFVSRGGGGLVVTSSPGTFVHRDLIIALAARHKLPAVYPARDFAASGALVSYAADFVGQYRHAASTLIASSEEKSRPVCQCRRRPNTNL